MESVSIIGGSILGLISGINLLKEGYLVNIYEKRDYIGGMFNSFSGVKLSKPQLFDNLVLSELESLKFKDKLECLEYEKIQNYKYIKFNDATSIEIKFSFEEIKKLFFHFAKTEKDKVFVENILADLTQLYTVETLLENKNKDKMFDFNKWINERTLNNIKSKYKKIRVENILDKIDSIYLKEIIKSLVNVKCSAIVLIDMLKYISFYNIYNIKTILETLENEILNLGATK